MHPPHIHVHDACFNEYALVQYCESNGIPHHFGVLLVVGSLLLIYHGNADYIEVGFLIKHV